MKRFIIMIYRVLVFTWCVYALLKVGFATDWVRFFALFVMFFLMDIAQTLNDRITIVIKKDSE